MIQWLEMNETACQVLLKIVAMVFVLFSVSADDRDWIIWTLIGLILLLEVLEPLERFVLRRFPSNRFYQVDDPIETARTTKTAILFGEAVLCGAIFLRVYGIIP